MPTTETRILDNIIASRRALLVGGGAAMAALAMPTLAKAASTVSTYTDADILNFALNLEYLEATSTISPPSEPTSVQPTPSHLVREPPPSASTALEPKAPSLSKPTQKFHSLSRL